jgi:dTDP-4-amino-4,6-dideoxygalactose transaminase
MYVASLVAGVEPGDEVLLPTIDFPAACHVATLMGAKAKFVDVDRETLNVDIKDFENKITRKSRIFFPVHLYGRPSDMAAIMDIAKDHNIVVVKDCAHAPGAEYNGKKVGSIGHMAIFSFQMAKMLSTLGEGGVLATNDDEVAEKAMKYRQWGFAESDPDSRRFWEVKYEYISMNFRMEDARAAIGISQLKKLDSYITRRTQHARKLSEQLSKVEGLIVPPETKPGIKHAWGYYAPIFVDETILGIDRDEFLNRLRDRYGISAQVYYRPCHILECYQRLGYKKGECPVAEEMSERLFCLPIYPRFSDEDIDYLAKSVREVAESGRKG